LGQSDNKPFLFDLTLSELEELLTGWGEPTFRARQIYDWLYVKCASDFDEMSDLPKKLRDKLKNETGLSRLTPTADRLSSDKWTRKILFNLPGDSQVETVLMGYHSRRTACISTQAGCGLGCTFCATGQGGLQRNISSGEIVEQAIFFERALRKKNEKPARRGLGGDGSNPAARLTNVVFMGMGEPFANYKQVMKAVDILTDPKGFNFGARRITISTVGLVPEIYRFAEEKKQVNLAVSLHAATDRLRQTMLPINKKYPLVKLIPACLNYTEITGRRLSFEWALIDEINDTEEQARALASMIKGMLCHVNLIPLNPTRGFKGHESKQNRIKAFRAILDKAGITNTLRLRRGIDINAGCGQLRQEKMQNNR